MKASDAPPSLDPRRREARIAFASASALKGSVALGAALLGVYLGLSVNRTVAPATVLELSIANAAYLAVIGVSAIMAIGRAAVVREERLAWSLIAGGLVLWMAGDFYVNLVVASGGEVPVPSPVDGLHLAFYTAEVAGLILLARREGARDAARFDAVMVTLGLATLWSWLVLERVIEDLEGNASTIAVNLAYPILDLGLVLVLAVIFSRNGWPRSGAWLMIGTAFVLAAVADSAYTFQRLDGTLSEGPAIDAVWGSAAMLLGVAALVAPPGTLRSPRFGHEFTTGVSVAFTAIATLVLVADHFSALAIPTLVLAVATLAAALIRSAVVLAHSRRTRRALRTPTIRRLQELALSVDARDPSTDQRSDRVAMFVAAIGARLGFDSSRVERLVVAAKLSEVGMLAIPVEIANAPGPLTAAEHEQIERHPVEGQRMVAATGLEDAGLWIRHHHEHWDGSGYPDGLAGPAIPIESRILGIAAAVDAISSDRPYHRRLPAKLVAAEIAASAGSQFDPGLARVVSQLLRAGVLVPGAEPPEAAAMDEAANPRLGLSEYLRVHALFTGDERAPLGAAGLSEPGFAAPLPEPARSSAPST